MGAPRLHIVDLDGAATGEPVNVDIIREMAGAVLIPVQVGGGIRRLESVEQLLKYGVDRVILGTAAVENPEMVKEVCRRFTDSVIIGVDTREGYVTTHGWQQGTETQALEFTRHMVQQGARHFIYTDINRDGTLTEPNFTAIFELVTAIGLPIIAAGGISSLSHLGVLERLGVEGAIVGTALYTGDINLKQALTAIN